MQFFLVVNEHLVDSQCCTCWTLRWYSWEGTTGLPTQSASFRHRSVTRRTQTRRPQREGIIYRSEFI